MGIDTYVIVPVGTRAAAEKFLRENPELEVEDAEIGDDFVALYREDRFLQVQRDPELWGASYARLLPASIRGKLDRRGILVVPELGQTFVGISYDELAAKVGATWLPLTGGKARRRTKRILLVHLSANRQAHLRKAPSLVREIVAARLDQPIPDALDMDDVWIELQKLLFDHQWESGATDARSEALAPRKGLPLYEDKTIDASLLVPADQARATAEWVLALPDDVVARVRTRARPSPASQAFPANLGASEGDDLDPPAQRRAAPRPAPAKSLEAALVRLRAFYRLVQTQGCAVLAIRFRG